MASRIAGAIESYQKKAKLANLTARKLQKHRNKKREEHRNLSSHFINFEWDDEPTVLQTSSASTTASVAYNMFS